jgi:hypothetical protein
MLPLTSLQVGLLYEFLNKDFLGRSSQGTYLGKYESTSVKTNSILFALYASSSDFSSFFEDCKCRFRIPRLVIIKQVIFEDLPLYINWNWHAPRYLDHFRGSANEKEWEK